MDIIGSNVLRMSGHGGLLALLLRRKQEIWLLKVSLAESKQKISSYKPCLDM